MYRPRLVKVPKVRPQGRLARLGLTHSTDLVKTSTSVRRISTSHENFVSGTSVRHVSFSLSFILASRQHWSEQLLTGCD